MFQRRKTNEQRNRNGNKQPDYRFVIEGTELQVAIWKSFDRGQSQPTYRWHVARSDGERLLRTFRLDHLLQMALAVYSLAAGFSQLEDVTPRQRESLMNLVSQLEPLVASTKAGAVTAEEELGADSLNRVFRS